METIYHNADPQVFGCFCLLVGIILRYIIGRRRFNRRGIGGLQEFGNFEKAVGITLLEWLIKWIANVMIIAGIVIILTN